MIDWSKISDTNKYVIDDDNAKRVYDVLQMSYVGKNKTLPTSLSQGTNYRKYKLEYKYEDGVLYIEEHTTGGRGSEVEFLLDFLIAYDDYYLIREHSENGTPIYYDVRDEEGKYFARPPKTEYEIQEEAKQVARAKKANDMPF